MRKTAIILVVFICLILFSHSWSERRLCRIFVWDIAGPEAVFTNPNPPYEDIRPNYNIIEALNQIQFDRSYGVNDSFEIISSGALPGFLDDFTLIFICTGWLGSGGRIITDYEDSVLFDWIRGDPIIYRGFPKGLYIEGNNFAYDYGDTSSEHHTYSRLMYATGGVLWLDEGFYFDHLIGEPGSIAENMFLLYPGEPGYGPHSSMDIIGIYTEALPVSEFAQYVFSAGLTKDPARGMQRRGYAGGGATILYSFVFGNISDSLSVGSQANLMFTMVDFMQPPTVDILSVFYADTLYIDSTYIIQYHAYDNCGIVLTMFDYSMDGGSWMYVDGFAGWDSTFAWTIPSTPADSCVFRVSVWDSSQNWSADTTQFFRIDTTTVGIPENELKPETFFSAYAYPNPFNARTNLFFEPKKPGYTEIKILNLKGECIQVLCDQYLCAGKHRIPWECLQKDLPSGLYFANIRHNGQQRNLKLMLLR